ncbi:hypothetical protein OSC18_07670 [Serratia nevei]|uniref:hypothetical protein n=1 Tax=Serratia nevei TaxID=2703794 RepID=UPI00285F0A23|nr:hypothetical protein [Serratia nevei]MDR8489376.1 hypothetical protein [Serratia nevei]
MKALVFVVILLSGCSVTKEYQSKFDSIKFRSQSGLNLSVDDLKRMHLKETGKPLETPNTAACGSDSNCYYNAWADVYDKSPYRAELKKKQKEFADRKERECLASKGCLRDREIANSSSDLRVAYYTTLSTNPYLQSELDYAVRTICNNSARAQRSGVSKEELMRKLQDAPGIDPQTRSTVLKAASACWTLSSLNYDWNEALRN